MQPEATTHSNISLENAVALHRVGRLDEAQKIYSYLLNKEPANVDVLQLWGMLATQTSQHQLALELAHKAVKICPEDAFVHCTLGMALFTKGKPEDAVQSLDYSIRLNPHNAEAYCARGMALEALGQLQEALHDYEAAASLNPQYAEAYFNQGNVLKKLGRHEEAVSCFDQAISLRPMYAEAHNNRGSALKEMDLLELALKSYEQAIQCNPAYAEALTNKGIIQRDLQRLEDAIQSYDMALEIDPDYNEAHWSKAITLLLKGDLEAGFHAYEWRWKRGIRLFVSQPLDSTLWLGSESLEGKTIVLFAEQGYGDAIQFSRYILNVALLGARVILQVPIPLIRLLKGVEGVSQVIVSGQEIPAHDFHCPLMSLPLAFQTRLDSIPIFQNYLQTDTDLLQFWRSKLGHKKTLRVGLAWSGSTTHLNDVRRSMTLSVLEQFLPGSLEYVCLQKELREADAALLPGRLNIRYWGEEITDFADTAALCELMDIVISVDTSVAHLAASLGKTTWILLPYAPDWRWMLHRCDSPWYPSVRLYRQDETMSWQSALVQMRADLTDL